ncbi:MAG: hypothetical protein Q9214_007052, partial [Letrouitia sp. 1 TL-2023]
GWDSSSSAGAEEALGMGEGSYGFAAGWAAEWEDIVEDKERKGGKEGQGWLEVGIAKAGGVVSRFLTGQIWCERRLNVLMQAGQLSLEAIKALECGRWQQIRYTSSARPYNIYLDAKRCRHDFSPSLQPSMGPHTLLKLPYVTDAFDPPQQACLFDIKLDGQNLAVNVELLGLAGEVECLWTARTESSKAQPSNILWYGYYLLVCCKMSEWLHLE